MQLRAKDASCLPDGKAGNRSAKHPKFFKYLNNQSEIPIFSRQLK
jgi:hypothetical protein